MNVCCARRAGGPSAVGAGVQSAYRELTLLIELREVRIGATKRRPEGSLGPSGGPSMPVQTDSEVTSMRQVGGIYSQDQERTGDGEGVDGLVHRLTWTNRDGRVWMDGGLRAGVAVAPAVRALANSVWTHRPVSCRVASRGRARYPRVDVRDDSRFTTVGHCGVRQWRFATTMELLG